MKKRKETKAMKKITLAMTGASGFIYGLRLLECLIKADIDVYVVISQAAHAVAALENDLIIPNQTHKLQQYLTEKYTAKTGQIRIFGLQEWTAPIASGSNTTDAMVICPCSSGALSAIATGASNNLIERAADVMIKERKPLILVPRETPLSAIHLQNMHTLALNQVVILPAMPGFYHKPKTVEDMIDFVVARIMLQLGIDQTLLPKWGQVEQESLLSD